MTDAEKEIREALAAGPTPGPWTVMPANAGEQCVARINAWESVPPNGVELAHDTIDAAFIAACNPDAIRELLAERDELRRQLAELTAAAIRYDAAIKSCANDPERMSSFCTAEGDDLDALYDDWIGKARAAMGLTRPAEES